jgi:hypothetical protein
VLVPVPVVVLPPGDLVSVHVPDEGNPVNITLPVPTPQVGWVIVPTAGALGNAIIVIVKVVEVAHCPAVGEKVYAVVAVLLIAGLQVPVTLLVEVVCKAEIVAPAQYGPTAENVGTMLALTVTDIVAVVAHCPAVGVKV